MFTMRYEEKEPERPKPLETIEDEGPPVLVYCAIVGVFFGVVLSVVLSIVSVALICDVKDSVTRLNEWIEEQEQETKINRFLEEATRRWEARGKTEENNGTQNETRP